VMSETPKDESSPVDKNTKEQYEELGRFVVAFEDMVNDVRELCIFILAGFNSSQQTFVSVAFHNRVLTAQPLFEIMQTLIAEVAKDKDAWTRYKIDDESATIINGVIAAIRGAYEKLASIRNNLLHGTWYIGFTGPQDLEAKQFYIRKLVARAAGLSALELPKTAAELRDLTNRCEKVRYWMSSITACFILHDGAELAKRKFWYDQSKRTWFIRTQTGDETLPAIVP
jgi:hypothetical protein